MKIDILSDLHLDFYFKPDIQITKPNVKSFFDDIFRNKRGKVLIIAGDIGHYNKQNIEVLKIIKEEYYKNIVCVLGNHDYYLLNHTANKQYNNSSFNRVNEMRELLNTEDGIYCLNGNIIEIDGVRFGGADCWYSDDYRKLYYPNKDYNYTNKLWKVTMFDANVIKGVKNFDDIFNIELPKIEAIYKECDIMITHVNPSHLDEHIHERHRGNDANTFFCFNGHKYLKDGTMKYWVFGHTHDEMKYDLEDVQVICNPLGYPSENNYVRVKSIEI